MLSTLLLAGIAALAPIRANAAQASDWNRRAIYQVMTDRFALPPSEDSQNVPCDTSQQVPCGGTWAGITSHLDYIAGMGFGAVWISPIVAQLQVPNPPPPDGTAYHGYWPEDLLTLNPSFGTASDLQALVSAVHSRNMYIMLDVVVNHMATYNTTSSNAAPGTDPLAGISFSGYDPYDVASDYHSFCTIEDNYNQTQTELCWLGSSTVPLADVDTEDPTIVSFYNTWIQQMVSNYSFDGLRIDTVKNVRADFWPAFTQASGVFCLGEVDDGRSEYVGNYTNYVDAIFDYPGYFSLVQAFQNPSGSMSTLSESIQNTTTFFKNGGQSSGVFLENHDNPRFPSYTSDQELIKNAISFVFVGDGIPIIYEGQEQGYTGGAVPLNREAIWLSGYETQKPLYEHITTLNKARQAAINASSSFLSNTMTVLSTTPNAIAISKNPMLAVLTNIGSNGTSSMSLSMANAGSGFTANSAVVEVLSCTSSKVDGSGNLAVTNSQGAPQLFMPQSAVGALCPSLAATPAPASSSSKVTASLLSVATLVLAGAICAMSF